MYDKGWSTLWQLGRCLLLEIEQNIRRVRLSQAQFRDSTVLDNAPVSGVHQVAHEYAEAPHSGYRNHKCQDSLHASSANSVIEPTSRECLPKLRR